MALSIEIGDYSCPYFPGYLFVFLPEWKYDSTEAVISSSSPSWLSSEREQFGVYFSLKTSTHLSEVSSKSLVQYQVLNW